jgi:hypothetical protein
MIVRDLMQVKTFNATSVEELDVKVNDWFIKQGLCPGNLHKIQHWGENHVKHCSVTYIVPREAPAEAAD